MCHIKAIKRRRRECVCGRDGGQKIQLSLATRFKTAKIDSTMTLHRRLKSKECFLQLDQRGACRSALFICERNVHSLFFILFHYVELCAGSEAGPGRPAMPLSGFRVTQLLVGKAIKSPPPSLTLLLLVQNYNIT